MNLKELLEKALEAGLVTHDQVKAMNKDYVHQNEVNRIVSERVNETNDKYKPVIEENENLKKQITELEPIRGEFETLKQQSSEFETIKTERDKFASENNELLEKVKGREYEDTVTSYLNEVFKGKDLPPIYRSQILKSDDYEAVKKSIDDTVALYKTNHPVEFGGGANPGAAAKDFSQMSTAELLHMGLKK